jgi:hypothetical protein
MREIKCHFFTHLMRLMLQSREFGLGQYASRMALKDIDGRRTLLYLLG